jgi:hypothetical protein
MSTIEGIDPVVLEAWKDYVRQRRNELLAQTDWMFMVSDRPDVPNKTYWAEYRQALRDITKQTGFPVDVIWPTRPDFQL